MTINFSLLFFSLFSSLSFFRLFSTSLSYLVDREMGWRIELDDEQKIRKRMEKKKSREKLIFISFTHYSILLCFPFFSIFLLHSYLLRFLASLFPIFLRCFRALYIIFFLSIAWMTAFLQVSHSVSSFRLTIFAITLLKRISANPRAFLLKKRD